MVSTISYSINMYAFKNDNPTPETTATLEILMRQRYQLQLLQTNCNSDNSNDESSKIGSSSSMSLTLVDDVVSPVVTSDCFGMPPHVITLPKLRQMCVLDALARVGIEASLRECVGPEIEAFAVEVAETCGVKEFDMVAEVEVVKSDVFDQEKACSLLA